jgi:hypothetical protein
MRPACQAHSLTAPQLAAYPTSGGSARVRPSWQFAHFDRCTRDACASLHAVTDSVADLCVRIEARSALHRDF